MLHRILSSARILGAVLIMTIGPATQAPGAATAAPRLLGPGIISTPDLEYDTSFTPDGRTVYFTRGDAGYNRLTVLVSHWRAGRWSLPQVAPFSGVWEDADAHLSPDGRRLFFISNRPTDGGSVARSDYDIWMVERSAGGGWSEPHHLPAPINSDANDAYPTLTDDGTLYFESTRPDHPGIHIYRTRATAGGYAAPELIDLHTRGNDINPTLPANGRYLIFASRDRGGLGAGDLFIAFRRTDGGWTEPRNLGPTVNSTFNETAPNVSRDGRTLYFASNRIDGPLVRQFRASYAQIARELHSPGNGLLSIYAVELGEASRPGPD